MKMSRKGISLMEILLAMLVLGLASTAIFTAFSFGRKVSWRSEMEIMVQTYSQELLENLRLAVLGDLPSGLTIQPGYYVDENMAPRPAGATALAVLDLPDGTPAGNPVGNLRRFQTGVGDGVSLFVEGLGADSDGDGSRGIDFDADGQADLLRVHLRVQWTLPDQG